MLLTRTDEGMVASTKSFSFTAVRRFKELNGTYMPEHKKLLLKCGEEEIRQKLPEFRINIV